MRADRILPLTIISLILLNPVYCPGQDYESAAESAIEFQRFPWEEAGELVDFETTDPGSAASADRGSLPIRVTPTPTQSNMTMPTGWLTFFNSLVWVIISAVVIAIAGVLIWMYLKMDKRTHNTSELEDYDNEEMVAERIKQLPFELNREQPGNLAEQAKQHAQTGNYGRAMMFLFSHVLLSLDKNELIRLKKGKTNRQYLRELRQHNKLSNYYQQVMIPFEDAFFGNHRISESRFEECWNDLSHFESNLTVAQQVSAP